MTEAVFYSIDVSGVSSTGQDTLIFGYLPQYGIRFDYEPVSEHGDREVDARFEELPDYAFNPVRFVLPIEIVQRIVRLARLERELDALRQDLDDDMSETFGYDD